MCVRVYVLFANVYINWCGTTQGRYSRGRITFIIGKKDDLCVGGSRLRNERQRGASVVGKCLIKWFEKVITYVSTFDVLHSDILCVCIYRVE